MGFRLENVVPEHLQYTEHMALPKTTAKTNITDARSELSIYNLKNSIKINSLEAIAKIKKTIIYKHRWPDQSFASKL